MTEPVGLRAQGLCIEPFLHHGVPSSQAMEVMIKEIDEQLEQNSKQLEECVLDLLDLSNELPGTRPYTNPIDAVNFIADGCLLDKNACYDTDPEGIAKLLKHALNLMDKQPGCEEKVLQQLLQLSSEEGLALPLRSAVRDPMSASVLSINTVTDSSEHLNESLWKEICHRLRRYFIDKLHRLPVLSSQPYLNMDNMKRLEYLQSLCTLYPPEEIWQRYRILRAQQLDTLLGNHLSGKEGEVHNFSNVVSNFGRVVPCVIVMITADFEILNSGVFEDVVTTFHAIKEIYLEKLSDEITMLIENLQEEISTASRKEVPKSNSEATNLEHAKVNKRNGQSKSLDSLVPQSEEQFTDLMTLPEPYLGLVLKFVMAVHSIENHVENLHKAMRWEVVGIATKKAAQAARSNLKGVLKTSPGHPEKKPFSPRSFEKSGLLPDAIPPPFGATQAMVADSYSSFRVSEKEVAHVEKPQWEWRLVFKKMSMDISKALEGNVRRFGNQTLEEDQESLEKYGHVVTVDVSASLVGGRLDYPKVVIKGVRKLMDFLDQLLPLAKLGLDQGVFAASRSAFIDSVAVMLKNWSLRLSKIAAQSPEKYPIKCAYIAMSSAAYIRNHLLFYENVLGSEENNKKTFLSLYKHFCELVDAISRQVVEHQAHVITTCVLYDAESYNWNDSKDFYENERCSFPVQAWNLHMRALQHDLWSVLPPKLAQSLYGSTLQEGLLVLANRYARAKPAYRRTTQFRTDITALLLMMSELLLPACNCIHQYLDPHMSLQPYYSIHNACCSLLATMTVVASPLENLYKVYKKGFYKKKSSIEEDEIFKGYPSHWLAWTRPSLLEPAQTQYEDMQTTTAVYLQLRLLAGQPECNWVLLLQSLLMKEYTLPIMLLTQAANQNPGMEVEEIQDVSHKSHDGTANLFEPFVDVFMQCSNFPDAVAKVLVPVIERSNAWSLFDSKTVLGKTHVVPGWMQALNSSLREFTIRIIEPALRLLIMKSSSCGEIDCLAKLFEEELPCGCQLINRPQRNQHTVQKDPTAEAMYSVISQLVEDIHALPTQLCIFFKATQEMMNDRRIQSAHNSVAIKILAGSIRQALLDVELLESLIGYPLSSTCMESLVMLAECVYHALTSTSYNRGSTTPRIAGLFMKANRTWLHEQIEILTDYIHHEMFDMPDEAQLEGATAEYTENLLMSVASSILNSPSGERSMQQIYHLIVNNMKWITQQLDIPGLLNSSDTQEKVEFVSSMEPIAAKPFNAMEHFDMIGPAKFDHMAIGQFNWDWTKLLQSDLGLTEVGFKTLLYNRHEMQDGTYLEESEKKPVEVLKSRFDFELSEVV